MSFETTLICDGCGCIVDGGTKRSLVVELQRNGGRAFRRNYQADGSTAGWKELGKRHTWERSGTRHLGACCADATRFLDGEPISADLQGEEGGSNG